MGKFTLFKHTAKYYETDKMGIVHHSNYIRWFEDARIHYLKEAGFPYDKMEEIGVMIPVLSAACNYKNAVRFGETVAIKLKITSFNGFKLFVSYEVIDDKTGELRATGETSHFFVNNDFKPIRVNRAFPDIYHVFYDNLNIDFYD